MRCLVTGAAGFIGNALVQRLIDEGHSVRALIHQKTPESLDCQVRYIAADLTDPSSLPAATQDVDVVFHCAAIVKEYGSKRDFLKVNVDGTKNLAEACSPDLKRFVFLSHFHSDSGRKYGWYSYSKGLAEQYLSQHHHTTGFPVVVIRPGNVIGPGEAAWVIRPLRAIQHNRIAFIDKGSGIFLHTYIDNLLDALIATMHTPSCVGETIEITDGDNTTTWGEYLNAVAHIAGKQKITKKMSKSTALTLSYLMKVSSLFGREPLLTPSVVHFFTNKRTVSLQKAEHILGYKPKIEYTEALKQIQTWLKTQRYV
jgi:nucleoside-diphosphate-sugar epimerase